MALHRVTITNATTTSPAINVAGQSIVGLSIGTVAAATATFTACFEPPQSPKLGSMETQTFRALRDDQAAAITVTTTDDSHFEFDPPLRSVYQLKIVANVAASGDEVWTVITRNV